SRLRQRIPTAVRPLLEALDPRNPLPEFMIKRTHRVDVYSDHLMSIPRRRWHTDLAQLDYRPAAGFARQFAAGSLDARREFARSFAAYRSVFDQDHGAIRELVAADLGHRGNVLSRRGLSALLGSLHPAVRWRAPVLEVSGEVDQDVDVAGRAVRVTPSVFMRRPGVLVEAEAIFIAYPVRGSLGLGRLGQPGPRQGGLAPPDPLGDLLGRTRAAVLRALSSGRTTSELAEIVGISLASASHHATVLRRARLITTHREGRAVRHQLTPLGRSTAYADPHG
ncbi:MAG: ArsR/SmtB family transcription factor, partial [Micromonosporaceae bacterium]